MGKRSSRGGLMPPETSLCGENDGTRTDVLHTCGLRGLSEGNVVDYKGKRRRRTMSAVGMLHVLLVVAVGVLCCGGAALVNGFVPSLCSRFPLVSLRHKRATRAFVSTEGQSGSDDNDKNNKKKYWIAPDDLERLKESVDIVDVLESYNLPQFKRKGQHSAVALCPFHNDRNPSLSVDATKRIYKCFACGAGGDVFRFVQEYSALQNEKMTYMQAVRHVAKEFGYGSVNLNLPSGSSGSNMSEKERQGLRLKKERLLLANAAAADYYGQCLVTLPSAGLARSHLRSRGLSPATVRTFAMGFAPDAYYSSSSNAWGDGSLVNRLRGLGFTPEEIVEAGLAIRTKKKAQWKDVILLQDTKNETAHNDSNTTIAKNTTKSLAYSTLMDRFRGRLMVPIFDAKGEKVLGFGGRILLSNDANNNKTKFTPPKYLNSPESPVFSKSQILFGQHVAQGAIKKNKDKSDANDISQASVIVVEGYMDAVALTEVGIPEVVASMGTAVSLEQLATAARIAGTHGGRIVLCLDGDEAGISAVERLCSGNMLSKTCDKYAVEIVVADLPEGIKDPAEYIESRGGTATAGDDFRKEVLGKSKDWTVWYLEKLMSRYDPKALRGSPSSFPGVCERVSDFLANFENPLERTKRSYEVAGILSQLVSGDKDSGSLRIQLESDLVAMTSRKAAAKESVTRRVEQVDGVEADGNRAKIVKMAAGEGLDESDTTSKLSKKALEETSRDGNQDQLQSRSRLVKAARNLPKTAAFGSPDVPKPPQRRKMRPRNRERPPMTPHFSGFEFENENDADWLGVPRNKRTKNKGFLTLGSVQQKETLARRDAEQSGQDYVKGSEKNEIVYFNSNEYHGQQFVTPTAIRAGYSDEKNERDHLALLRYGVSTLVRHEPKTMVISAENKLLRTLLEYPPARNAMKSSIASSDATGTSKTIEWSSPDKAWLYGLLVDPSGDVSSELLDSDDLTELWESLSNRPDVPEGAFGSVRPRADLQTTSSRIDEKEDGELVEFEQDQKLEKIKGAAAVPALESAEETPSGQVSDTALAGDIVFEALASSAADDTDNGSLATRGSLDDLFVTEEDPFSDTYDDTISRETRAELVVQESLSTLAQASVMTRLACAKNEWLAASQVLQSRLDENDLVQQPSDEPIVTHEGGHGKDADLYSLPLEELKERCRVLVHRVRKCSMAMHELDLSSQRIRSRLLDYSNSDVGRFSVAKQQQLVRMLNDHLANLPQNMRKSDAASYEDGVFSRSVFVEVNGENGESAVQDDDGFERELKELEEDWGEWSQDGYFWSSETEAAITKYAVDSDSSMGSDKDSQLPFDAFAGDDDVGEDEESVDDFMIRIREEWGDWSDVDAKTQAHRQTSNGLPKSLDEAVSRETNKLASEAPNESQLQLEKDVSGFSGMGAAGLSSNGKVVDTSRTQDVAGTTSRPKASQSGSAKPSESKTSRPLPPVLEYFEGYGENENDGNNLNNMMPSYYEPHLYDEPDPPVPLDEFPSDRAPSQDEFLFKDLDADIN